MGFVKNTLIFLAGAATGGITAWFFSKRMYERFNEEEFDKWGREEKVEYAAKAKEEGKSIREIAADLALKNDYVSKPTDDFLGFTTLEFDKKPVVEKKEEKEMKSPYLISINDFKEYDDYDGVTYVLYSDGTMTDDDGYVMDQDYVNEIIGKETLEHMGEEMDGLLYVRNDNLKLDVEIQYDTRSYKEFQESNPFNG